MYGANAFGMPYFAQAFLTDSIPAVPGDTFWALYHFEVKTRMETRA